MFEMKNISPNDIESFIDFIKKENIKLDNIYKYLDNFIIFRWEEVLCGFGFGLIENKSFFIKGVYVNPNYRNKGIGSTIVKAMINKCDVQNINKVYICDKDIGFYENLKFIQISTQDFIENRETFLNIYDQTTSFNIYFVNTKEYVFNSCCQ